MTLNSGIFRTLVASLVLLLAFVAVASTDAQAREIRIFPVPAPAAPCAALAYTGCDLVRAAAGLAPTTGPDAGVIPGPGDTLVLAPGTYTLVDPQGNAGACAFVAGTAAHVAAGCGPVVIPGAVGYNGTPGFPAMESLKIRSRDGANVTVITEAPAAAVPGLAFTDIACVHIGADAVELGGPGVDQGVTVRGCGAINGLVAAGTANVDGVVVGAAAVNGLAVTPAGQADEFVTIQNSFFFDNAGDGVDVASLTSMDTFKVMNNNFRGNVVFGPQAAAVPAVGTFFQANGCQMLIRVGSSVGTRGADRNIVIEGNTFDGTINVLGAAPASFAGLCFTNGGTIEQTAILNNQMLRHGFAGFVTAPFLTQTGIPVVPTDFEESIVSGNYMQQNGVFGAFFFNIGRIENVNFTENRGQSIQEGITGNGLAGLFVAPSVTDIRDSQFTYNNFNANGILGGAAFFNATDFETLEFGHNSFRQNAGLGLLVINTGDQDEINYVENEFRNNGIIGSAHVALVGRIQNHMFDGNQYSQNSVNGLFMAVFSSQDVESTTFVNGNLIEKNGGAFGAFAGLCTPVTVAGSGMFLGAGGGGDVGEIMWDDLHVLENTCNGSMLFTTTGDVTNITGSNARFNNNGGTGLALNALTPVAGAFLAGDIQGIDLSNSSNSYNGTRTAIGFGSGMFFRGDNVDGFSLTDIMADNNNDHGAQWSANSDVSDIVITSGSYSDNDQNVDSVGNGLDFSSNDTAQDINISGMDISRNNTGVRFNVAGRSGRNLIVNESTLDDNRDTGVAFFATEDMTNSGVSNSELNGNAFGISFLVNEDGSGLFATGNSINGTDGMGTGILLDANNVTVDANSIRRNDIGIEVRKMDDVNITGNNIARNETAGVDATSLAPGSSVDAAGNWWGEPSGPKHDTNPNGIGDRVSDRVIYEPFLGEPAVPTDVNFQIIDFNVPATGQVGTSVTITALVRNNGTEEGTQNLKLSVDGADFSNNETISRTLNQATETEISFTVNFPRGGSYSVTLTTQNDSAEATIDVTGPTGLTIEQVCDANDNNRIDDDEILTCIGFWVTGEEVPGTGQTINDAKILFLIELWVTNGDISTLPASARTQSWVDQVVSFFAPAARVQQSASVNEVAPGGSFTLTTTINANESLSGLLLSEQLPQGWTISNIDADGGFFKASENKVLWINGTSKTVTYTVNVPANAAEGTYTLSGLLNTADGFSTAAATSVRVAQSEVLSVNSVAFANGQFIAQGSGITGLDVQVFSLDGGLVFSGESTSGALSFNGLSNSGQVLANGVYLYVMTVQGTDGQQVRTSVNKLVVLR